MKLTNYFTVCCPACLMTCLDELLHTISKIRLNSITFTQSKQTELCLPTVS